MKTSDYAISKLKEFEGFRAKAYKPVATEKYYTIAYGHCGPDVGKNMTIDESMGVFLLRRDLAKFEKAVNGLKLELTQCQFDALVDFCYNLGFANLQSSTLLKYIKQGKPSADIQAQFKRWNKAGGRVLAGLTKRREWEANMWVK